MRCDAAEEEKQVIARYLGSLRYEILDVIQLQQYWTYADVCRLALKVEKQAQSKNHSSRVSGRSWGKDSVGSQGGTTPPKSVLTVVKPISKKGQASGSNKTNSKLKRCYKCQGLRHFATDCPNQSIITLVAEKSEPKFDESDEEQSESSENGEIIYVDQGESLELRRILNVAVSDKDQCLRNNIFHMKCTSKRKTCNVIIDGGSCENMVSETMAEKLGLKTEKHPRPHKLLWFRKGNEVKVDKRCLVQFSIGQKYHDELWCDVVPMDAFHMLLGRPW
ncbi:zf-CCHC domain-containing protein/Asp_protease_2 domain-containing protein [Cephalotus follicularis]|uniref:Zf-CCHC domain-containing protein/Asp_protease_2 domain-containing protein n=1 Tax=Cephalotus follicularis TaxID=3775 RepID=A0A1Q3C3F8_CEPFO|nr:zf-CCHC domain-containing protein/Asp_protease_2 domain-containing protein [Cephalotus follicularis]